jgi:hypothetical protein
MSPPEAAPDRVGQAKLTLQLPWQLEDRCAAVPAAAGAKWLIGAAGGAERNFYVQSRLE